jgi:hypothetical protein
MPFTTLTINVGAIPMLVRTDSPEFARLLEDRYGGFITADAPAAAMQREIKLMEKPGFGVRDSGFGSRGSGKTTKTIKT